MRYIPLIHSVDLEKGIDFDDIQVLEVIAKAPKAPHEPNASMSVDEVYNAVKVLDCLETARASNKLVLEEAQYEFFVEKIKAFRFTFASKQLSDLLHRVLDAENVAAS